MRALDRAIQARSSRTARALALIAALGCLVLGACDRNGEKAATASAYAWLPTVDAGDYSQSWANAAPYLQHAATQSAWEASMNKMRAPLGKVLSRTTTSAVATRTALNDPCVIVKVETAFEHRPAATETITVMPANDAQWKVAGYFIQ
jgi:hypothetical protein